LLPASADGDLAFLGLLLAGKVPVLLNWTTGPAGLAACRKSHWVVFRTIWVAEKVYVFRNSRLEKINTL
jgi:hypothetical protein